MKKLTIFLALGILLGVMIKAIIKKNQSACLQKCNTESYWSFEATLVAFDYLSNQSMYNDHPVVLHAGIFRIEPITEVNPSVIQNSLCPTV